MTGVLAYPTYGEFERAAKAFTGKYTDSRGDVVGPGRTNKGWEWKESQHKVRTPGWLVGKDETDNSGARVTDTCAAGSHDM